MYTVLNELSVRSNIGRGFDKGYSRGIINNFVEILHKTSRVEGFNGLITTADIHSLQISSEYGIQDWLEDPLVDRKYKEFFRIFRNKRFSYIENDDYSLGEFEIVLDNQKYNSLGCLVASEMNESVISLKTHGVWLNEIIEGLVSTLDSVVDEITTENREINNISQETHLDQLEEKLKEENFAMISSGQDLWEKREILFPNLVFCESVKDQLYNDPQKFHIEQVAKKLMRLQQYFSEYDGIYNPKVLGLNARTESETVKSNKGLKDLRRFKKPDDSIDYFYDHIGFTSKYCGRIHFLPDDGNRKCFIGYIGKHLPTKYF